MRWFPAREARTARRRVCIAMMLRHVAGIPPEGRRHQCTTLVRHSPTRRFHFSSGQKCSEHCPRALPYLAENKSFGATPVPLYPLFFGGYPHPGPPPFAFFVFFPLHAQPHLCRVPLVHAAAAWHRTGMTPLMHAAWNGATAALNCLLELRADLDAQDSGG